MEVEAANGTICLAASAVDSELTSPLDVLHLAHFHDDAEASPVGLGAEAEGLDG